MCALDLAGCLYFYKVVFIDGSLPTVIERFSVYNLWIRSKHVEVLGLWIGSTGDMGFVVSASLGYTSIVDNLKPMNTHVTVSHQRYSRFLESFGCVAILLKTVLSSHSMFPHLLVFWYVSSLLVLNRTFPYSISQRFGSHAPDDK